MINKIIFLSILALTIFPAVSCTAAPPPVVTKPAVQETVKPVIQPPVIKDLLGPKEAAPAEETLLVCWAIDPDGRKLTYTWSTETGTIRGDGRQGFWKTPDKPGSYTVSVKVANDAGLEASQSKAFTVVAVPETHKANDTTVYLNLSLSSNDVVKTWTKARVTSTNEIQCNVENQDLAELTFKWNVPIGKLFGTNIAEGKASRVAWIAPGVPGQYIVSVIVTDKNGREVKGEANFEVYAD
jgi:hypothetical protein